MKHSDVTEERRRMAELSLDIVRRKGEGAKQNAEYREIARQREG